MEINHNVSNLDIRLFLNNKLLLLEAECDTIRKAITLFEEAENELQKHNKLLSVKPISQQHLKEIEEAEREEELQNAVLNKIPVEQEKVCEEILTEKVDIANIKIISTKYFLLNLRDIRKSKGFSAIECGNALGVKDKSYYRLENLAINGESIKDESFNHIVKLSEFFQIELCDLTSGSTSTSTIEQEKPKSFIEIAEGNLQIANFILQLRSIREKHGKTLKQVGDIIDMSGKSYWNFESTNAPLLARKIKQGKGADSNKIVFNKAVKLMQYFKTLGEIPSSNIVGTIKREKTITGKVKTILKRTDELSTNGAKIKRKYKKREPKSDSKVPDV